MATASPRTHPLVRAGGTLLRGLPSVAPTFVVVALLACVLVPLPTALVDLLLSVSLAGSVLLLVGSLAIGRSSEFSNFPALLLLATLFRLALNVSTTRLILSQADAGRVVDAFASIVVRGDLIVGGVMFAIITIVQFGVIARGAERVAEVAARFALDGLPGHQAAIDADLRAGVISPRVASRRREELTQRSSFYGAMDGAIRFVKGDAIAGLAITSVNLVGGLAIGVGRNGMSWMDSMTLYGQLTVGDGLLAQIPALLVSLAAGVLVARVDRREGEPRSSVLRWLDPAMLIVPAALLFVLALIPGMPRGAFGVTAVGLVTFAMVLTLRRLASASPSGQLQDGGAIQVLLHPGTITERAELVRVLAQLRHDCAATLGIFVPNIEIEVRDAVTPGVLEISIAGRSTPRQTLPEGAGADAIVLSTFRAVMDAAPELVDLQALDRMLEQTRQSHPIVVGRALSKIEVEDVLRIVRGFLRERIRVPPLHVLLGLLAEDSRFHDVSGRPFAYEWARSALQDYWVHPELEGLRGLGPLRIVRLTPDAEAYLVTVVDDTEAGPVARAEAGRRQAWVSAIQDTVEAGAGPLVVVASDRQRGRVAAILRGVTPRIPCFSGGEMEHAGVAHDGPWLDVDALEET